MEGFGESDEGEGRKHPQANHSLIAMGKATRRKPANNDFVSGSGVEPLSLDQGRIWIPEVGTPGIGIRISSDKGSSVGSAVSATTLTCGE